MKTKLTEILKGKSIGDDVIQAILDEMKAQNLYLSSEENMDIRYGKLKTQNEGVNKQLTEAQALIEEMKKSTKGQEGLQQKITAYEQQVAQLQAELTQAKIDAEIKVGLLAEKALDVDYLTFKLKEKGEIALDENGKIKGWEDKVAALKTQIPTQFETAGSKKIIENRLPHEENPGTSSITKEEFNKMGYNSRAALRQENPELYDQMMKG